MTIDEAIEYYIKAAADRELADEEKGDYDKWNETRFMTKKQSEQIIADNRQIVEWLMELKEAKRLLKAAVEDMHIEDMCDVCVERIPNSPICCPDGSNCFVWRYKDEALKLIGGKRNDTDM